MGPAVWKTTFSVTQRWTTDIIKLLVEMTQKFVNRQCMVAWVGLITIFVYNMTLSYKSLENTAALTLILFFPASKFIHLFCVRGRETFLAMCISTLSAFISTYQRTPFTVFAGSKNSHATMFNSSFCFYFVFALDNRTIFHFLALLIPLYLRF